MGTCIPDFKPRFRTTISIFGIEIPFFSFPPPSFHAVSRLLEHLSLFTSVKSIYACSFLRNYKVDEVGSVIYFLYNRNPIREYELEINK